MTITENPRTYTPRGKQRAILDAAWNFVSAVPYKVTTRWLFYQLLQAGFYTSKDDYKNQCVPLLSRARHAFYGPWRPNSLADDRREAIEYRAAYRDVGAWIDDFSSGGFSCPLNHFYNQERYCEIWFEAEAMSRQFQHYTRGITLRPFSGMPSIAYKWSIAKALEEVAETYEKPITVLYFGDYDKAGLTIPETSVEDIRGWCRIEFTLTRCGLNQGDEIKYNIPENFEHPGSYQWEALNDQTARKLITESVAAVIDRDLIDQTSKQGRKAAAVFNKFVSGFSDYYQNYSQGGNYD